MSQEDVADDLAAGLTLLCCWSRNIAMLPLEKYIEALEQAEMLGPILDPTLYREYLYSDNAQAVRDLLEAGLALKVLVLKLQPPKPK